MKSITYADLVRERILSDVVTTLSNLTEQVKCPKWIRDDVRELGMDADRNWERTKEEFLNGMKEEYADTVVIPV